MLRQELSEISKKASSDRSEIERRKRNINQELEELQEKHQGEKNALQAHQVIETIIPKVTLAALEGENEMEVMRFEFYQESAKREKGEYVLPPEYLNSVERKVYGYCKEMGLNPSLKFWSDVDGSESGFSLIVSWE